MHFRDVVDLHVFDEQEQQTSAAIPFGIDTLGLWEEKPWKIDKSPIAGDYFDCDKGSTCLQPHVSDRWCANGWGIPFDSPNIAVTCHPSPPTWGADNDSTPADTPLRSRLLDERNSVSVSADSADPVHFEGQEQHGDPEDEQLVIIDGWQDLLEILHQRTPSPASLIHLEMYGLHITHHSIRITDCEATIAAIREAFQESWRDAMPPRSVAYIHLVRPQEQRHARAVVLQMIVEIVPFGVDIPPNDVPILRRIRWHRDHSMTLETAYMRDHQTGMNFCLMHTLMSGAILDMEYNAICISNHALPSWHTDITSYLVLCWKSSSMMMTDRNRQLLLSRLIFRQDSSNWPRTTLIFYKHD